MLHLNLASIIPHKLSDKLKGFIPTVNKDTIRKFFYESYLDVHEDDSLEELKAKMKKYNEKK